MDATTITLVTLLLVVVGGVAAAILIARVLRQLRTLTETDNPGLVVLQGQIDGLREQVRKSLEGGRMEIDRRLEETNRVVGEVRRDLGQVGVQVRSVREAARDLRGLQELLRSPKVRGGLGETLLAELLAQVLPQANFALQYEFSSGERVDAVLKVGDRLVPVDSKFPLENFRRLRESEHDERAGLSARRAFRSDVRRHVDAIAKRYIQPGEGTYEFAMMYVPAEAVYQELILQNGDDGLDLCHYALTRQVVPVSPQSFYAYLQVIVLGLRGLTIETRAREIMNRLGEIRSRLNRFTESFEIVLRHLGNAQRQTDESARRLARLEAAVAGLSSDPVARATAADTKPESAPNLDH